MWASLPIASAPARSQRVIHDQTTLTRIYPRVRAQAPSTPAVLPLSYRNPPYVMESNIQKLPRRQP
jgi:hypothetical protein